MRVATKKEMAILSFPTSKGFESWMEKNHATAPGLWLQIAKKDSGLTSISYAEALDVALCYGWIDGQKKSKDAKSYLQKFTPRRPKSLWSKVNREHVERLTRAKKMKPSGMAQVEAAKKDGRWERAYDSSRTTLVPEDFILRLKKDKKAYEFFKTLTRANVYSITWRLQTAKKPETREKRVKAILQMLKEGKAFH
ncbi:MAG TPA: YdeI/OmpD-associated family protein [Candidatus Paceibacterota bacterium]|nr:YdeI/OmpD-associated family protein [Candidatus Paceibacterota bacterium]